MELTKEQIETITAALKFALDLNDTYFAFAPKGDYNDGYVRLDQKRAEIAQQLLTQLMAKDTQ